MTSRVFLTAGSRCLMTRISLRMDANINSFLPFWTQKRPPPDRGDLSRFHSDCSQTSTATHTDNGGCPEDPTFCSGLQLPKAFHPLKLRRKLSAGDLRSLCHSLKCTCFGHRFFDFQRCLYCNLLRYTCQEKFKKSFKAGDCRENQWMVS